LLNEVTRLDGLSEVDTVPFVVTNLFVPIENRGESNPVLLGGRVDSDLLTEEPASSILGKAIPQMGIYVLCRIAFLLIKLQRFIELTTKGRVAQNLADGKVVLQGGERRCQWC
jgi:hypothetical protein